jgi:hypothetical protein
MLATGIGTFLASAAAKSVLPAASLLQSYVRQVLQKKGWRMVVVMFLGLAEPGFSAPA